MNPVKLKLRARSCIAENRLDEARAIMQGLCKKTAADADAWHLLGAINGMLGRFEDAEQCARKVIALQPAAVAAHNNLVSSLLSQKKLDLAETAAKTALKLCPDDPQALNNFGSLMLQRQDYATAAGYFSKAVQRNPAYAEAHNNLGSALLGMDALAEARGHLEKALQLKPGYPDALFNFGQLLFQKGELDAALHAYKSLLNVQPAHVQALLGAAEILKTKNMHAQAEQCIKQAMSVSPGQADIHVAQGTLRQQMNQHEQALEAFQKALDLDPVCIEAMHYSSASLKELGDIAAATALCHRILELKPDFVQAQHMLETMGAVSAPEKADSRYVADLFDAYANKFDEHLVGMLEYRTPEVLREQLVPLLNKPESQYDAIDLGCGTGLCAPLFKPWCRSLIGVDLSRKMLARAEQRGLYDKLIAGDILEPLSNDAACYDLILSADVFVYVGKLDEVFCCCEKSLRPHGMLAFSIELLSQGEQDYYLHGGGRYSHSKAYIERLAATASLSILAYNETILRKEKGADVAGAVFVLAKPAPGG